MDDGNSENLTESSAVRRSTTVLIVEDDQMVRELLTCVVEQDGYAVATAANGKEALEYLEAGQPACVILLDLMMPVMSGWEFREAQKRHPSYEAIPLVVLSGVVDEADARQMNAASFLRKPVGVSELLATVERHCGPS